MDMGYSLYWPAGSEPYFVLPDGSRVTFEVEGYIPFMRSYCGAGAMR